MCIGSCSDNLILNSFCSDYRSVRKVVNEKLNNIHFTNFMVNLLFFHSLLNFFSFSQLNNNHKTSTKTKITEPSQWFTITHLNLTTAGALNFIIIHPSIPYSSAVMIIMYSAIIYKRYVVLWGYRIHLIPKIEHSLSNRVQPRLE